MIIMMIMIHNNFRASNILYNVNNNDPLNDREYDHEDDNINCKNYPITNRIKNEYIKKMLQDH